MSNFEGDSPSFFDHMRTTLMNSATTVVLLSIDDSNATGIIRRAMAPVSVRG